MHLIARPGPIYIMLFMFNLYSLLCCMPAGHGGWRSSLVLLPRCLWLRPHFDGPLWGREPPIGICGCPIRVALGWGTAAVVPVLAATTTCPVARVRFHRCFIVIYFLNMFICIACVKWVPTNTYVFMSTRFWSGLKYPGLAFLPLVPHICIIVLGYLWFR